MTAEAAIHASQPRMRGELRVFPPFRGNDWGRYLRK